MKFIEFQMKMMKMIVFFPPPFAEKKVIFGKWASGYTNDKFFHFDLLRRFDNFWYFFLFLFYRSVGAAIHYFHGSFGFYSLIFIIKLTNFNGFFGCFSVVLCSLKLIIFDLSKIKIHFMAFSRRRFKIYIRIYENLCVSNFDNFFFSVSQSESWNNVADSEFRPNKNASLRTN